MAANWNAILSNANSLTDILMILRKVLAGLDGKADITLIDEALVDISKVKDDVANEIEYFQKVINESIESGLYVPFSAQADLLAYIPDAEPVVAKAFDTKKVWIWETRAPAQTPSWHDTGLSELDQATSHIDKIASLKNSLYKILDIVDANSVPVLSIFKDKSVWIPNLKKDIASSINILNQLLGFLYSESGQDLIIFKDSNGAPIFRISKDLEVDVGKYRIKTISESITNVRKLIHSNAGEDFLSIVDSNNFPLIRLLKNQDLLIPKIGNLTSTVLDIKRKLDKNIIQNSSSGGQSADLVLATLVKNTSSGTLSALTASTVNAAGVFPHQVNLIRIPAITRIQKDKYLCFFEARVDSNDFGMNSQGVCTLTVDINNLTVSADNIQAIHAAEAHQTIADAYYTFMNACAVKLDSGRIITLYVKRYGTGEHYIYKRYSDDDGLTWSDYEDIGTQLNMSFYNLLCPSSQGLVKRNGSFKGRVIFPVWYSGRAYNSQDFRAGYIYSDDDGLTWSDGFFNAETLSNEVQCAEDTNGDLLFCIRRETTGIEAKTFSKVYDGEYELTPFTSKTVVSNVNVMSGLIQSKNKFDLSTPKFQYIGTYSPGRKDLKIFTSYDGGLNWINEFDVPNTAIGSIYSCIENLNEYYTFALWEYHWANEFKCQILSINDLVK